MSDSAICILCEKEFELEKYEGGACPNCGQVYKYDEGYFISLSEEQLGLLRQKISVVAAGGSANE